MWSRGSYGILFFTLDIVVLTIILFLGNAFLFTFNTQTNIILLLVFIFAWLLTYRIRYFVFDYYTHIFMAFFWSSCFCLIFFVANKQYYNDIVFSIYFLISLSLMVLYRFSFVRLTKPAINIATQKLPQDNLMLHANVNFHKIEDINKIKLNKYDCLLYEHNAEYPDEWRKLIAHAQIIGIPILTPSYLEEYLSGKVNIKELHHAWINNSFSINRIYLCAKRLVDLILTILLLPILIVIGIITSLLIYFIDGSTIMFIQDRIGQDGKIFKLYKFRTMKNHNNKLQETIHNDSRITILGKFLRKFRIDELPQFINILKNEMSLIGPRPERADLAEKYGREIPIYNIRHLVKPGITGWAQTMYGYTNGIDGATEKLQYDLFYVKHFSLWIDIRILFKTAHVILCWIGAK